MCVRVRACVYVCVHVCVRVPTYNLLSSFNLNTLESLLLIINKSYRTLELISLNQFRGNITLAD